jgi:ABC-type glycerol-3-phosphate transport system substrate-binding protein
MHATMSASTTRGGVTRRAALLSTAVLAPAAVVACGGQPSAGGAQPAPSKVTGKVLVMSYQTSSPKLDMQQALYDEFNKEFKPQGLEVEFVNPGQTVIDKVTTMHVAGTPADMWEWPRLWRELEGIIAEITPFMTRDKIDEKQWIPESINVMKQGGKVWGMPVSISADAMAYNLDLLQASGLKAPPQDPDDRSWTMDAFLDTMKKLTKAPQQFGFGGSYTCGVDWMNAPTYFGYGPVDLAAKKVTINTPGFQQGLQYWIDMLLKHHVQPTSEEAAALRATPSQNLFLTGKIGMTQICNLADRPDFRWGIAALPYTPNSTQPKNVSGRISVHALFMDSDSKNKEQAWQVFKYWMRPDKNQRYVLSDGHVVSPLVKTGSEVPLKDFQDRMGADAKAFFLQAQRSKVDAWGYYLLKDWFKARTEIDALFTEAKAGRMSVPEFAQKAQEITERTASF